MYWSLMNTLYNNTNFFFLPCSIHSRNISSSVQITYYYRYVLVLHTDPQRCPDIFTAAFGLLLLSGVYSMKYVRSINYCKISRAVLMYVVLCKYECITWHP